MKIGILGSRVLKSEKKGFYNDQQIGLAKALTCFCDKVIVYKTISSRLEKKVEAIQGYDNIFVVYLPSKRIGNNGIVNVSLMNVDLDILIYFSDTQFSVPKVYRWAKKNNICFYPYIGVTESHNNHVLKRIIVNCLFARNLNVYKKCHCFVKTPAVENYLRHNKIKDIQLLPVGLDLTLMKTDYAQYDVLKLKEKYGYLKNDKIILFIGRLTEEKQPVRMIEILSEIVKKDKSYKLLMVGNGELKDNVIKKTEKYKLYNEVKIIESISNKNIWELYCMAEVFVNLNSQEIFGMAILEAMYYGCKVVAWKAPGPNFIIENGVNGWLAVSNMDIVKKIEEDIPNLKSISHNKILEKFTWYVTAKNIFSDIRFDVKF